MAITFTSLSTRETRYSELQFFLIYICIYGYNQAPLRNTPFDLDFALDLNPTVTDIVGILTISLYNQSHNLIRSMVFPCFSYGK